MASVFIILPTVIYIITSQTQKAVNCAPPSRGVSCVHLGRAGAGAGAFFSRIFCTGLGVWLCWCRSPLHPCCAGDERPEIPTHPPRSPPPPLTLLPLRFTLLAADFCNMKFITLATTIGVAAATCPLISSGECAAWSSVFDSLGGANWGSCSDLRENPCACDGGHPHTPCDHQPGVCCRDGHIVTVNLRHNQLVGEASAPPRFHPRRDH